MLAAGLIEPSFSTKYASNLTFPPKKAADGKWTEKRMCNDVRALNEATITDHYHAAVIEEQLEACLGSTCFTVIDCRSGYNQCKILPSDKEKTTFWWGRTRYQYTRLVMGMKNATAHFQRVMDHLLGAASLSHCAFAYVDDVLVHSPTPEQHIIDVSAVLDAMGRNGMKAHPEKCIIGTDVIFKIQALLELKAPDTISALRSVLGLFRYYAVYSPNFSADAAPLNDRLKKEHCKALVWDQECEDTMNLLKRQLTRQGAALKRFDPSLPIVVHTDWSSFGIGCILAQTDADGKEYMVACSSRSLNKAERNYASYHGEMLAVLAWLMSCRTLTGQHARWALSIQDYDFDIRHRPGVKHQNVDALSRCPLPTTEDGTGQG